MKNYKKIIEHEDLFKIFIGNVPYFWRQHDMLLGGDQEYKPACLYKESVDVLRNLEKLIWDINQKGLPEISERALRNGVPDSMGEPFLRYFESLKFDRGMFDTTYLQLNRNWDIYDDFLKNDEWVAQGNNDRAIAMIPSIAPSGERLYLRQWNSNYFSQDKIIRLVHSFTTKLNQIANPLDQSNSQEIYRAYDEFDKLLSIHQQVYTFIIDIRFVRTVDRGKKESLAQFIDQLQKDRQKINDVIFQQFSGWLQAYTKLEHDYQNGLNLSCILILKSKSIDNEKDSIARLQEALKYIFSNYFSNYDDIVVMNRNDFIRARGNKHAVGHINEKTPSRVDLFKYWVLSYFFQIDYYAKLKHPQKELQLNELYTHPDWNQPDSKVQSVRPQKVLTPKRLLQILQEWTPPKNTWNISHLSKSIVKRLEISRIYYKEFFAEIGEQLEFENLLFQFEVFIETVLYSQCPAFSEVKCTHEVYDKKDLSDLSTQVGMQYMYFLQQWVKKPQFFNEINYVITHRGLNTWWFRRGDNEAVLSMFQQLFGSVPYNYAVNARGLNKFNTNIDEFRHNLQRRGQFNYDGQQVWESHYTQCVRRHSDTQKYLNMMFKQNCWAYRIVIKVHIAEGDFQQQHFARLFTEFMRLAKRAKPCSWLNGYFGVWQESYLFRGEFSLDVVLLFNDKCQEKWQSIVSDLNQRWIEFLNEKAARLIKLENLDNRKIEGSIESKVLMKSIEVLNMNSSPYSVCVEASNMKMKKIFNDQVIPYFAYRDLFQNKFSQTIPKVFIKGAIPKNAVVAKE